MRMRQSLAQLEREFEQEAVRERQRREQLQRASDQRDPQSRRKAPRSSKHQKLRFLLLWRSIALTVVVVTWRCSRRSPG